MEDISDLVALVDVYYTALRRAYREYPGDPPTTKMTRVDAPRSRAGDVADIAGGSARDQARPASPGSASYITVYGKSFCPYSLKAEQLVANKPDAGYIDMVDGYKSCNSHKEIIDKQSTIPIVIMGKKNLLGGFDELDRFYRGVV